MSNPIHRPYAQRGTRKSSTEPSVTTILNMLPKPGLPYGASKETAVFAVLHPGKWQHLGDAEAIDLLRTHFRGVWNSRAANGTVVHEVAECYADGRDVDLEDVIARAIDSDPNARTWRDRDPDELVETVLGYVLGVEKWWGLHQPDVTHIEQVVRCPGKYIGTMDLRARVWATWPSDGFTGWQDTILDWKTTAAQDEDKGLYFDSWRGQLCALAFAEEAVFYEQEEDKRLKKGFRVVEARTEPWTPPERTAVVHLRGDGDFTFYEVPTTKEDHVAFLQLADAYRWVASCPNGLAIRQEEMV